MEWSKAGLPGRACGFRSLLGGVFIGADAYRSFVISRDNDVRRRIVREPYTVGFVGSDTWGEWPDSSELMWWPIGTLASRFALAAPPKAVRDLQGCRAIDRPLRVATSYVRAATWFMASTGIDLQLDYFEGAVEPLVREGFCDAVYDVTETRRTLYDNGLRVLRYGPQLQLGMVCHRDYVQAMQMPSAYRA